MVTADNVSSYPQSSDRTFLLEGGETGRLIRERDWSQTALGPIALWPAELMTTVQTILSSPVAMVVIWGPAGTMIYNDGYAAVCGPRHPEALGGGLLETWPEARDFNAHVIETGLSGQALSFPNQELELWRHGRPEHVWMDLEYTPVRNAEGTPVGILAMVFDITGRVRAEQRLRDLNEMLEAREAESLTERRILIDVIENTDAIIQVLDRDYRVLAINRAAGDAFDRVYGSRPAVGDVLLDLFVDRPADVAQIRSVWDRALAGEEFGSVSSFGSEEHGSRWFEMNYRNLHDQAGTLIGAYQFVYDVTDRIEEQHRLSEAEEALRQAQKVEALGQLTGGVAHDFNNLLTPIIGSLDMLVRKQNGTEREQRLIEGALQSAERARTLVQRLLAFARRQPLQPSAVDVGELITGMAQLIASTMGPQIRILTEVADDLPPAQADQNQLEMALLNLSVNARDAMPERGTLRISARAESVAGADVRDLKPGRYVRISVADTGHGMAADTLARAIEPFFSTKGVGKGTGLGLSMVHGLTRQLGGATRIFSQPELGTNVEIWIPVSADTPVATHGDRRLAHCEPGDRGVAFVVDDEDRVRDSTAHMLEGMGFDAIEFSSAEDALVAIDRGDPASVVVTDHLMPGMNGTEFVRAVIARRAGLPCLIVSGYAEVAGVAPDLPRLAKPFLDQELRDALGALGV